jgi:hypothetical protein
MPSKKVYEQHKGEYRTAWDAYTKAAKLTPLGRAGFLVRDAKRRAKVAGLPFDLDREWVADKITKGICEVTGIEFDLSHATGRTNKYGPSLDRRNPKLGYTKDNVQLTTWIYNQCKNEYSHEDVVEFAYQLLRKEIIDDDDDLTPGTGAVASDDNEDYWNSTELIAVAGGVPCYQ